MLVFSLVLFENPQYLMIHDTSSLQNSSDSILSDLKRFQRKIAGGGVLARHNLKGRENCGASWEGFCKGHLRNNILFYVMFIA